jgi:hypothetical protein
MEYWCLHDVTDEEEDWDNPEWVFAVTPIMRKIWNSCANKDSSLKFFNHPRNYRRKSQTGDTGETSKNCQTTAPSQNNR